MSTDHRGTGNAFALEVNHTVVSSTLAELDAAGVNRKTLRTGGWRRTSHGRWAPCRPGDRTPSQRIVDALPLLPDHGALAGWAAAYVLGVAQLDGIHPHTGRELPIVVALGRNVGRSQSSEVIFSRERLPAEDVTDHLGVRVTTARRTAFDLARWAADLTEAVAAVDAIGAQDQVLIEAVRAMTAERRGWRGIPLARRAAALARSGTLSTWESRLRVVYQVEAGLPSPLINRPLADPGGRLIAVPDMFDPEAALATEFDGADHRERQRHSHDNVREELLESANVIVTRVDSLAYRKDRRGVVLRLQDAYRRGLRRDRSQDGWRLSDRLFCAQ